MDFKEFTRRPFVVEAVQITAENIEEVAEFIGTVRTKDDGTPYIQINRDKMPVLDRVYIGYWFTRMDGLYRCYAEKTFNKQFRELDAQTREWVVLLRDAPSFDQVVVDVKTLQLEAVTFEPDELL